MSKKRGMPSKRGPSRSELKQEGMKKPAYANTWVITLTLALLAGVAGSLTAIWNSTFSFAHVALLALGAAGAVLALAGVLWRVRNDPNE